MSALGLEPRTSRLKDTRTLISQSNVGYHLWTAILLGLLYYSIIGRAGSSQPLTLAIPDFCYPGVTPLDHMISPAEPRYENSSHSQSYRTHSW